MSWFITLADEQGCESSIEVVKEMDERIKELEQRVTDLEKKVAAGTTTDVKRIRKELEKVFTLPIQKT